MSYSRSKPSSYNTAFSDMEMTGDIAIEADGDFDGGPIDVDDEDLNAAFEAEHGAMFTVIDEVGDGNEERSHQISRDGEKNKFVIPRMKRSENDDQHEVSYGSGDEGKREWRKKERDVRSRDHDRRDRDRDAGKRERDGRDRERDTRKRDRDDSRDSRGERGRHHAETKRDSHDGRSSQTTKPDPEKRQSLFESFAQEGLIADDQCPMTSDQSVVQKDLGKEGGAETKASVKKDVELAGEEDASLEIPMGRDSLVFVRDYHAWQIRLHPVSKADMARTDFAQTWGMADSSSVVWSSQEDFGGVAEFLLKDQNSVQKFMRKILWHNFSSGAMTVEVTERETSKFGEQDANGTLDTIANKMIFKYHNSRARQLIKTYYPTPQGEVTERSVYVNNINSGKAVNLLKAAFPCAAKISVARSTKETSSALVETASVDEAFNYLVVYDQINVNNCEVLLSTVHSDWEGAKKDYEKKDSRNRTTTDKSKPSSAKASDSTSGKRPVDTPLVAKTSDSTSGKRPADTDTNNRPSKRGKPPANPPRREDSSRSRTGGSTHHPPRKDSSVRGRSGSSRGGRGGRGGAPTMGRHTGRPLLPDPPMGGGDGLLPLPPPPPPPPSILGDPIMGGPEGLLPHPDHLQPTPPLMAYPANPTPKGMVEAELLGPPEPALRSTMELTEIRQQLESRVMETRAQLESHLSRLDQAYRTGVPPKPRRPGDYMEEEERHRDTGRRTLLPMEGRSRPERDEWLEETAEYRRPAPPPARSAPPPSRSAPPPPSTRSAPPPSMSVDRSYEAGMGYGRGRQEEDYGDVRSSRPRPYLLEAPPPERAEEPNERPVYDYEHARRRPQAEPEARREDVQPLLSRPALLERDRRDYPEERTHVSRQGYPEERSYSGGDRYDYEDMDSRRAPAYGGYEEDSRHLAPRYKDDYDRRY